MPRVWPENAAPSSWSYSSRTTATSGRSSTQRRPRTRDATSRLAQRFPDVHVSTKLERGDAAERIVAVAEELRADAIVLGNRGTHGSWWRVRDSVPNLVLRHAPCSVFIVDTRRAQ
jgi:nucleotide-binding universal stress UspA family protein